MEDYEDMVNLVDQLTASNQNQILLAVAAINFPARTGMRGLGRILGKKVFAQPHLKEPILKICQHFPRRIRILNALFNCVNKKLDVNFKAGLRSASEHDLITLLQEVLELVSENFCSTNDLADLLENLLQFSKVDKTFLPKLIDLVKFGATKLTGRRLKSKQKAFKIQQALQEVFDFLTFELNSSPSEDIIANLMEARNLLFPFMMQTHPFGRGISTRPSN